MGSNRRAGAQRRLHAKYGFDTGAAAKINATLVAVPPPGLFLERCKPTRVGGRNEQWLFGRRNRLCRTWMPT